MPVTLKTAHNNLLYVDKSSLTTSADSCPVPKSTIRLAMIYPRLHRLTKGDCVGILQAPTPALRNQARKKTWSTRGKRRDHDSSE